MEWLAKLGESLQILDWISEPVGHFLSGYLVAFLTSWLILTILYARWRGEYPFRQWKISTGARFGIVLCCLLGSVALALLSHWALDSISAFWTTPLGPHLTIIE